MLRSVDPRSLGELTPLATITTTPEVVALLETVPFHFGTDGWGSYFGAGFEASGLTPFAIRRYELDPPGTANLFILGEVAFDGVPAMIARIADALNVPQEAFRWRDANGETAGLAPRQAA
jgi:hypothetical protein